MSYPSIGRIILLPLTFGTPPFALRSYSFALDVKANDRRKHTDCATWNEEFAEKTYTYVVIMNQHFVNSNFAVHRIRKHIHTTWFEEQVILVERTLLCVRVCMCIHCTGSVVRYVFHIFAWNSNVQIVVFHSAARKCGNASVPLRWVRSASISYATALCSATLLRLYSRAVHFVPCTWVQIR